MLSKKILVVDDEKPIAEILRYNLVQEGYAVVVAYDGEEATRLMQTESPDLVLLDIMLPKKDGFAVCRDIRRVSNVPIIMLTAKDTELDTVLGLELGADDYVTKPFSAREVLARVKAQLRRTQAAKGPGGEFLICDDLQVDTGRMEIRKNGVDIDLTYREYLLLVYLMRNAGYVISREKLLSEVWGYDFYGDERTVDVTIRRLREKIEENPSQPRYIRTKRGAGYFIRRKDHV
ncbi:response regulator [Dethiobacter alkaliphilus]|uniref:Two component transcriptional regulator, winged helix family n=1 Tax=Dethiobacter alkaliphilus AHT 1 TaxID=555088 RepID=C0GIA2_DETAL|nr:response regulator [Dethiobacter alkaliphilus]EEG76950.1 two component transcriptional regulator, winged helix family [Dethiobacter alkaliphilus AHT 1]